MHPGAGRYGARNRSPTLARTNPFLKMPAMNPPTARPNDDPDLARWGLLALALVVGAFLMVYYVHLLQDSVARAAQSRYGQQTAQASAAPAPLTRDTR